MSASWWWEGLWQVCKTPRWSLSRTKMAIELNMFGPFMKNWSSCYMGGAMLSQKSIAGWLWEIWKSFRRVFSHTISQLAVAIFQYSDSIEDRETFYCFLDFQDTKESPSKTQRPVIVSFFKKSKRRINIQFFK